jgi:hypothetical protein
MSAINHRIATSGSVTPKTAATYWIGAASVSIWRPRAATEARSAFSAARGRGLSVSLLHERRAGSPLAFHRFDGGLGPAALCRLLDHGVYLAEAPVEVADLVDLDVDLGRDRRSRLSPLAATWAETSWA